MKLTYWLGVLDGKLEPGLVDSTKKGATQKVLSVASQRPCRNAGVRKVVAEYANGYALLEAAMLKELDYLVVETRDYKVKLPRRGASPPVPEQESRSEAIVLANAHDNEWALKMVSLSESVAGRPGLLKSIPRDSVGGTEAESRWIKENQHRLTADSTGRLLAIDGQRVVRTSKLDTCGREITKYTLEQPKDNE